MVVCNSGEYQDSKTVCSGCSLPIMPAGVTIVVRVPSATTPSMVLLPSDSVLTLGRLPSAAAPRIRRPMPSPLAEGAARPARPPDADRVPVWDDGLSA